MDTCCGHIHYGGCNECDRVILFLDSCYEAIEGTQHVDHDHIKLSSQMSRLIDTRYELIYTDYTKFERSCKE